MKRHLTGVIILMLSFALGGCGGKSTPPTPVFGDVRLGIGTNTNESTSVPSTSTPRALQVASNDSVTIDEARLNLRRVDLKPDTQTDPGVEYTGPFVINLVSSGAVTSQAVPSFSTVSIPVDTYSEIKYRVDRLNSSEIPTGASGDTVVTNQLSGHTLVVTGSFTEKAANDINNNGTIDTVPFRFLSDLGADLSLSLTNKFRLDEGELDFIFLAFDLHAWFDEVLAELQGLSTSNLTEGVAVLSAASSSAAVVAIVNEIEDTIRGTTKFAESTDDEIFEEEEIDTTSVSEEDILATGETVEVGELTPEAGDTFFIEEARLCLNSFILTGQEVLPFTGPFILSLIESGQTVNEETPLFTSLDISVGNYTDLSLDFSPLSPSDIPTGSAEDAIVTDLLADHTLAITGQFQESAGNDIDQDGSQSFIPFILVSDDYFDSLIQSNLTNDFAPVLYGFLEPEEWFAGTLSSLQALGSSNLESGILILTDSSDSSEIATIVEQVEANLNQALP